MIRIHPIQTGTVVVHERQRDGTGRGPARLARTLADRRWTEPLPILAWAIEHPEGLIVVDTGETARAAAPGYFPAWNPYFRLGMRLQLEPADEIGPALERLGLRPRDVRRVVLTHLHTDHAVGQVVQPAGVVGVQVGEHDAADVARLRQRALAQ